jgi:hypothetical protein
MDLEELTEFMKTEQGEKRWDNELSKEIIRRMSGDETRWALSLTHFSRYLLDARQNSCWNPEHLKLYQDMKQPLNCYFINSSHNTYLTGDQWQSESKAEMYQLVLLRGCRSLELDCWDGPSDKPEPIIYHGYTRTSKVMFEDVIHSINDYAFQNNHYPVSLSLEVHTSVEQQGKMAEIMQRIFKEKLATSIAKTEFSPWAYTPELLKDKFLVKAKMSPVAFKEEHKTDEDQQEENDTDDEEDNDNDIPKVLAMAKARLSPPKQKQKLVHPDLAAIVFLKSVHLPTPEDEGGSCCVALNSAGDAPAADVAVVPSPPEDNEYKQHRSSRHLAVSKERKEKTVPKMCDISSLAEHQLTAIEKKYPELLTERNKLCFSRVYPKSTRINSDNFDPISSWNAGVQMVALNFQTMDYSMRLNEAKFTINGGYGYILKPDYLRVPGKVLSKHRVQYLLKVKVISGQQIPKPNHANTGKVIDPYVEAIMNGSPADATSLTARTKSSRSNGFNPVWDARFTFSIVSIELALLTLRVMHEGWKNINSVAIAEATIPVNSLRQGYRCVQLHSLSDNQPIEGSTLFCHFKLDPR